jgi:hypothetical protein
MLNTKERKILIFFAGLWAAIEVSLGTILSLSKVPFRGFILAAMATFFLIATRTLINKPRTSLYIATLVAVVKFIFSIGAGAFNSAIAIFIEGIIAEIIFSTLRLNLLSATIGGGFIVLYPFFHSLFAQTIIFGTDIFKIYNKILLEFQFLFGRKSTFGVKEIIITFALLYFVFGTIVGTFSYYFSKKTLVKIIKFSEEK